MALTARDSRTDYYRHQADEGSFLSSGYNQAILGALLARIPANAISVVCDVGSGLGSNLPTLRFHYPGARLIPVDLNLAALKNGCTAVPGASPVVGDAAALPLGSHQADLVVCTEVLEHVADLDSAVCELARIMRTGAYGVISSPNYLNPMGLRKWVMDRRLGQEYWDPWGGHAGFERLMLPGLVRTALSAYFDTIAVRGAGYLMAWIPLGYRRIGLLNDRHPWLALGQWPLLRSLAINRYLLIRRRAVA